MVLILDWPNFSGLYVGSLLYMRAFIDFLHIFIVLHQILLCPVDADFF